MSTLDEMLREDTKKEVARLALVDRAQYDRERETVAEFLGGIRVTTLDKLVEEERHRSKPAAGPDEDDPFGWAIEPWGEPVDGAALFSDVEHYIKTHVILPSGAADAMTLWLAHAWTHDAAEFSPLLVFSSPEKRCGKTTALEIIYELAPRPLMASNITASAIFRAVEKYKPTLINDEAETYIGNSDELRGILNSGHKRKGAHVIRSVEKDGDFEPVPFSTWAPKAIGLIGKLADTLTDRSIVIHMRRKLPNEKIEKFSDKDARLPILRRKLARWAQDSLELLRGKTATFMPPLNDRAVDNWAPLIAIADLSNDSWGSWARKAAKLLSGAGDDDSESHRTLLLTDIKWIYARDNKESLSSTALVTALAEMENRPWPEWKNGKPITVRQLAKLLEPFKVYPKQLWDTGRNVRGYLLADFDDAFARYLSTPSPLRTARPLEPKESAAFNGFSSARNAASGTARAEPASASPSDGPEAPSGSSSGIPSGSEGPEMAELRHPSGLADEKGDGDGASWFDPDEDGNPKWEN